jgi:hypothetical protein
MKPKILLRIASLMMFLHAIGHTIGALTWKKDLNPAIQQVVDDMIGHKFIFMGASRSIGDFYEGYGMMMIFVLLLMAVLLWQLAAISVKHPVPAATLLITISLSLLAIALIEFSYFFLLAGAFTLIAGLLSGWSALSILKNKTIGGEIAH